MTAELWTAPHASSPLDATVDVPGSKSLTARYLILAAVASTPSQISGGLVSRDSSLMIEALRTLGYTVDEAGDRWLIGPGRPRGGVTVECGLAGTVMRFVPALALLADGPVAFDGDEQARVRPMGPLLDALRALGATVDDGGTGTLPITVTPPSSIPAEVEVDASASSQFVTALLLVAPALPHGLTVRHTGERLPSLPHIDMTCEVLRSAGITVDQPDATTWVVHPGRVMLERAVVEPDLSNAGPFMAAALAVGGTVRIPHWPAKTTQPGAHYRHHLTTMGGRCELVDGVMTVTGDGTIHGIDADLSAAGEITPTIAALCALADGPSRLTGIGHLRGHETDRLEAIATEVRRIGGQCTAGDDYLEFGGLPDPEAPYGGLTAATLESYHDHRMATFGAIIGLRLPGTRVENIATTAKTMPDFPALWAEMTASAA